MVVGDFREGPRLPAREHGLDPAPRQLLDEEGRKILVGHGRVVDVGELVEDDEVWRRLGAAALEDQAYELVVLACDGGLLAWAEIPPEVVPGRAQHRRAKRPEGVDLAGGPSLEELREDDAAPVAERAGG